MDWKDSSKGWMGFYRNSESGSSKGLVGLSKDGLVLRRIGWSVLFKGLGWF